MPTLLPDAISARIAPIMGSIRATGLPSGSLLRRHDAAVAAPPFVTISREPGAGGSSLARALVARLNSQDDGGRPWESLDRELIEKIAADHHISQDLIASLEESSHNWLTEFFAGITLRDDAAPSDIRIFHSIAASVRALAQAGRVVMVGVGAGFITANMPGGVHLRIVASMPYRVQTMARLLGIDETRAREEVERRDRNRADFFRRFFPNTPPAPERFTLTLNASALTEEQMVAAVMAVLTAGRS